MAAAPLPLLSGPFVDTLPRSMQSNSVLSRAPLTPTLRRLGIPPTRYLLTVNLADQRMRLWERRPSGAKYHAISAHRISSSRFGIGQTMNSNCTPLGLHRVARKIGGGYPPGTVFRGRQAVGLTWQGLPDASIVHRILWLEGMEPGFNRGGSVDSFERYIYIHGFGDETTLGRPASHGCIHVSGRELIALSEKIPEGTLVWIDGRETVV